jgi:hypothetical protein
MLPASDLSAILTNLGALNLQPNTAAQILAAVLAPLLRSSDASPGSDARTRPIQGKRARSKPRRAPQRKQPKQRAAAAPAAQNEHSDRDAPRQRAIAALKDSPNASLTAVAKLAGVSRSTVVNAARELGGEARKQARREARKQRETAKEPDRRQRAQRFLRDELAHGPKPVTDIEETDRESPRRPDGAHASAR